MLPQISTISHPVSQREHPSLLCGAVAPLFTPERMDGQIDFAGLEALTDHLCRKSSVSAIMIRTGEGNMWAYNREEVRDAIRVVVEVARSRKPVIAGTGGIWDGDPDHGPAPAMYFRRAAELSEWALAQGVAAVLQPVPCFLSGGFDYTPQERIIRFFEDIAREVNGPIVIYHQDGLPIGYRLNAESLGRLSLHRQLVGVIYYTNESSLLTDIVRAVDPRFSVVAGYDSVALPAFMGGAASSAGALAALLPEVVSAAWRSLSEPDLPFAWRAQNDLLKAKDVLLPYHAGDIGCAVFARQGIRMAARSRAGRRFPLGVDVERACREISFIRAAYL